ncbi:MAG: insulinase family protein [Clostridia bacterium]|nr:insulinase family protein [Clostridia bacterium]
MRIVIALMLVFAMMVPVIATAETADVGSPLPSIGDEVCGFKAIDLRGFPLIDATVVRFEHLRTGAELVYIANSDNNRAFDLTFNTQTIDNTGLPHVFEHATLDGSEKYPSRSLFFNLKYQSYNTYMNAMTTQIMTTYPVASLSEAQLLKLADFYTDSCLHPLILTDERIFREEAWRYRMESESDPLTLEGTVYSEMSGAYTLRSAAAYNAKRDALPGSYVGNVSGGDPSYIPDMTFEALKAYHDRYYHPSNCVAYLYGRFEDYTSFLSLLDDAFSPYERRGFDLTDPEYAPITEPVESEHAFPVEAGSDTAYASSIAYSFVCRGLRDDPVERNVVTTLANLLSSQSGTLVQKMRQALPTASIGCALDVSGPEDVLTFSASNVDRGDAQVFRQLVDEAILDVSANGFPEDMVEGEMVNLELSTHLIMESSDLGVDIITNIAYYRAATGSAFAYIDAIEAYGNMASWNDRGLYAAAAERWLKDTKLTALTVTYPVPGLKEQQDAERAAALQAIKDQMSTDERAAVIAASNALDAEETDAAGSLEQLLAVSVDSLPEEYREYTVRDEIGADGVRYIDAVANTDSVGMVSLLLDAQGISQEDIHWLNLFVSLTGELDTIEHTREELDVLINRYLNGIGTRVSIAHEGDDGHPRVRLGWIAMDDDQAAAYDLMYEIVFDTVFDDTQKLLENVRSYKSKLKNSINSAPYSVLKMRAQARVDGIARYYSYCNGLDYYDFLLQIEKQLMDDPAEVSARLSAVQSQMKNAENAIVTFAGSEESARRNRPLAERFMGRLDRIAIEPQHYDLPVPAKREALIVDASIQFNLIHAGYDMMGDMRYSAELDALSSLIKDVFLLPMLRDRYGVYGVLHDADLFDGVSIISYRDPNIVQTFDVYAQLPDLIRDLDLDQETLDRYIISSYTDYALSVGELSGAMQAIEYRLESRDRSEILERMRELKSITPEKVHAASEMYRMLVENGYRATAGGAAAIDAHADLYDVILNPFGVIDRSQAQLPDVVQDDPHFDAIRYVFDNGLMSALQDGRFGVSEPASVGDLALALCAMIGMPQDSAETAIGLLTEYAILGNDVDSGDELTHDLSAAAIRALADAIGAGYTGGPDADGSSITRAELAEEIYTFAGSLNEAADVA